MLCCPSALVRIRTADRRCPATSSVEAGTVETMGEPDLQPASYLTLPPRTPVVDRFGQRIGRVERVLLHAGGNFDGIIVSTAVGTRFVDAPEVRRISRRPVALGIAEADVKSPSADRNASRGGVPAVRWDRGFISSTGPLWQRVCGGSAGLAGKFREFQPYRRSLSGKG